MTQNRHRPAPSHAGFTHDGKQWDVTVSPWCGVYRVVIECESIQIGALDGKARFFEYFSTFGGSMKLILIIMLFTVHWSQTLDAEDTTISFRIDSDIAYPDLRVRIGKSVSYPDIRIRIGTSVSYSDFTVGISSEKKDATFVITKSVNANFSVRADDDVSYPDVRIRSGDSVSYPDVRIKFKKSGEVDYLVYTEKDFMTLTDMVIALLPAIHIQTNYEHEALTDHFGKPEE